MINSGDPTECESPNRPFLVSVNKQDYTVTVFRPRCKQWSCRYCAGENAADWRVNIARGVTLFQAGGREMSFITITSRGGKGRTREKSLEVFRKRFPVFRKRIGYAFGDFEYVAVPEQHKNGVVHMHIIATYSGGQRAIKDMAYKSGFGYIAHVRPVDSGPLAAAYLGKYMGKDFVEVKWPPRFRRVRCSRGWPRVGNDTLEGDNWYQAFFSLWDVRVEVDYWEGQGFVIDWKRSALGGD